jgi:myo-inositol-1-phosphate synthase
MNTNIPELKEIRLAIVGVGNCASSLYQGFTYYKDNKSNGIMKHNIGGYNLDCFKIVCAFDVDKRKVNKTLKEAILSLPNCTPLFVNKEDIPDGPIVNMGNVLDGIGEHMLNEPEDSSFRVLEKNGNNYPCCDIVKILKENKVDILINYLPVGSQKATEYYAQCCLDARVSLLNCIPVFIASNPEWEQKFIDAKIPLIGDDMKSQFGASILSQMLQELSFYRGHKVNCHIQRNIGGNTDFLNMTDKNRLDSKKISKENVIKCQNTIHDIPLDDTFFHAGPSEYIKYHKDNKIANIHLELEGFMGSPVVLDAQLSVIDSPNSAGVVIDAIRYLKVAREMGLCGSLRGPSAFTQKSPPKQLSFEETLEECDSLANRKLTKLTQNQLTQKKSESIYDLEDHLL